MKTIKRFLVAMMVLIVISAGFAIHDDYKKREACFPKPYKVIGGILYCQKNGSYHKPKKQ